ncbi:RHS repeat-associated core domain-containing protein [Viridibacillus sp. FSL H8-0123]|uniref:RHS repeat-associated core domain-containing protein n=1 Tax=Viridibacillus sp. FSL H8-0123 TaxID=1928922 RepID=UPI00096EFFDB|nr:RHS repeat-associated core domain-containing protein [Viridibacillus sp. FSL H8-0123]OMC84941.1 hypothetical protein BK130_04840 [Viridibacillus sp. FSL H8-0123]
MLQSCKVDEDIANNESSIKVNTDQRGNVISIRDNSNNEIGSYTYGVIGNVLDEKGEIAKYNTIRYAGYYYDHETKNYYLQARFYNPENGSFLALPMK